MLVFYPDFDVHSVSPSSSEVVLLLDTSESMRDLLHSVQEVALWVLGALDPDLNVNIILFGTGQFALVLKTTGRWGHWTVPSPPILARKPAEPCLIKVMFCLSESCRPPQTTPKLS